MVAGKSVLVRFEITTDHMKKLPPVEADDIIEPDRKTKKGGSRYVLYRY